MKKLVVFGDSFANMHGSWATDTASLIGVPLKNYSCCATSINYSFDQFIKYCRSAEYDSSDIIVFITSSSSRVYVKSMPNPSLSVGVNFHVPLSGKDTQWIRDNGSYLEWAQINIMDSAINYEVVKAFAALQSWASIHSSNTVIAIPAFDEMQNYLLSEFIKPTQNFYPLISKPNLINVSISEFTSFDLFNQCTSIGKDIRTNHLSECNLLLLIQMIAEVILTKNPTAYDSTRFLTNLYKNKQDYLNYENIRHKHWVP